TICKCDLPSGTEYKLDGRSRYFGAGCRYPIFSFSTFRGGHNVHSANILLARHRPIFGEAFAYVYYVKVEPGAAIGGEAADEGRSETDRGQHRQAARSAAEGLNAILATFRCRVIVANGRLESTLTSLPNPYWLNVAVG